MDLNAALREEFEALKSSAHSLPHAQLQAAWSRTMERALEALERKEEAFSKFEANKNELERKIETLSEDVGRWKEAFAEEENARALMVEKQREKDEILAYAKDLHPGIDSELKNAESKLRWFEKKEEVYRGEGPSPLWTGIFNAKKPDLLYKLLKTEALMEDVYGYTELRQALGTNEIKFLYATHPDSRNALKKLKVKIPKKFKYSRFPRDSSAHRMVVNAYEYYEMSSGHPDYSSGLFGRNVHDGILAYKGLL
jgi:hypothetical protein